MSGLVDLLLLDLGRRKVRNEGIGGVDGRSELGELGVGVSVDKEASMEQGLDVVLDFLADIQQERRDLVLLSNQDVSGGSYEL